jgi:hypothetical protein
MQRIYRILGILMSSTGQPSLAHNTRVASGCSHISPPELLLLLLPTATAARSDTQIISLQVTIPIPIFFSAALRPIFAATVSGPISIILTPSSTSPAGSWMIHGEHWKRTSAHHPKTPDMNNKHITQSHTRRTHTQTLAFSLRHSIINNFRSHENHGIIMIAHTAAVLYTRIAIVGEESCLMPSSGIGLIA